MRGQHLSAGAEAAVEHWEGRAGGRRHCETQCGSGAMGRKLWGSRGSGIESKVVAKDGWIAARSLHADGCGRYVE